MDMQNIYCAYNQSYRISQLLNPFGKDIFIVFKMEKVRKLFMQTCLEF